jgi:hypothetical protein
MMTRIPFSGRSTWGPFNNVLEPDTNEEDVEDDYEEASSEEICWLLGCLPLCASATYQWDF